MEWSSLVRGLSWGAVLAVLASFGGCSSPRSGGVCDAYCTNFCEALDACELAPKDCQDECEAGVGDSCTGAAPADRLTCSELSEVLACADYCGTLCGRAPSCGSFDATACVRGCAELGPSICNAASVPARTCDQLKPEIRLYESIGKSGPDDDAVVGGSSGPRFGLCLSGDDCEAPSGCSLSTNTCAACEQDADCKHDYESFICSEEHECVEVGCATDDDCFAGVCDAKTHECRQCRADSDCTGLYKACDTETLECVPCLTDAHCEGNIGGAICNPTSRRCGDCATNADCPASAPRCSSDIQICTGCLLDADCAGQEHTICSSFGGCVECASDTDCADREACDIVPGTCVED
jgi:hypothetical protein